ncbi:MAG: phosphoribosylglycinamide formyltransferase [Rickettsiales bacterium]|nr:phosphoribosylglycinamide formyltransferase [Rickettsiales bacterium]
MSNKLRTAVLISGNGGNLQALLDASRNDESFPAEISLVISNKPDAFGIVRAERAGIKTSIINHKNFKTRDGFDHEIHSQLIQNKIEIVCLAGFMRILTADFVNKWEGRMLNIHPSLLPSFKGGSAVKDALDFGVKVTGCSVHLVTPEIDSGEIIMQKAVEVSDEETEESLSEKIHKAEHQIYPQALKILCNKLKNN